MLWFNKKLDMSRSVGRAFMPKHHVYNKRRVRVHLTKKKHAHVHACACNMHVVPINVLRMFSYPKRLVRMTVDLPPPPTPQKRG